MVAYTIRDRHESPWSIHRCSPGRFAENPGGVSSEQQEGTSHTSSRQQQ